MSKSRVKHNSIKDITLISASVAIIALSSWISIPWAVNFTLQSFAIFTICSIFDLRRSMISVLVYIALGLCGIPVFSGFGAGFSAVLGPTGGYIFGFLLVPVILQLYRTKNKKGIFLHVLIMLIALCAIYFFGTFWYCFGYYSGGVGFIQALSVCVLPFIIPDILKTILAAVVSSRLSAINT